MANEEIIIHFGGNLGPLETALRGVKGLMRNAGESIKDSFKDAFHHLTAPLLGAGAFEAVKSMMEDVKNIKRISESTGLDTGLTQDLLNLGKAAGLAGGDIESAMDKFVKGLKPGDDPGDALNRLADKMEGVKDPAERARMAVEAFGRSGVKLIPILEQGSEGIRKMSEEWGKLSDVEIDQLEHANQTLEKAGQRSKVVFAQILDGMGQVGKELKKLPWWEKYSPIGAVHAYFNANKNAGTADQDELDADNARENTKTENARKAAEKRKEDALKAAKELAEQEEIINAKPEQKVLLITRQILALRRQIEDSNDDKERAKLTEKMLGLEKERKSVTDEIARTAKTAAEKQKQIAKEIADTEKKLGKSLRERETAEMSDYMPSVQDLANSGYVGLSGSMQVWRQGPFAQQAQELLRLQQDAKQSLIWGNQGRFDNDRKRIEELKDALRSEGVMSNDDRLQSIDENIEAQKQHMKDLLDKATGPGIKVTGTDDE